jgi:hypothetical protein
LLAASLPVILLAGVLIKLELSKGQLVIESDVQNISVKVLKGGQPVEGIQVVQGTTSTRLQADNYEITIDGPSDGLLIENGKFMLKNGQTVVVRIQHAPQATGQDAPGVLEAPAEIPSKNSAAISPTGLADPLAAMQQKVLDLQIERALQEKKFGPNHPSVKELEYEISVRKELLDQERFRSQKQVHSNAPVYAGKPLEDWLRLLRLERGVEGLKLAIEACNALVTMENANEITDTLLSVLPGLDGQQRVTTRSNSQSTLDYEAANVLKKSKSRSSVFQGLGQSSHAKLRSKVERSIRKDCDACLS